MSAEQIFDLLWKPEQVYDKRIGRNASGKRPIMLAARFKPGEFLVFMPLLKQLTPKDLFKLLCVSCDEGCRYFTTLMILTKSDPAAKDELVKQLKEHLKFLAETEVFNDALIVSIRSMLLKMDLQSLFTYFHEQVKLNRTVISTVNTSEAKRKYASFFKPESDGEPEEPTEKEARQLRVV